MIVTPTGAPPKPGVPDYYNAYLGWMKAYQKSGNNSFYTQAMYYARVAEEFGQVQIQDEVTLEVLLGNDTPEN